ncbi:thermonuclease family protein [Nitrosomonas aestuarii]|nr:thermonuclease family protein [Nitrosomonas aestuarii]
MNNPHKNYYRLYLTIFFCLITQPAFSTEIFRSEDATGSITYSDKAIDGARQIKLPSRAYRHLHQVKKVYDGDTLILKNGQRVRLLGINTPEIESRHRAKEPGGLAAKAWLENQLANRKVYLEFDLEKHDKYNRLLAHVFLPDGKHLNLELLRNGLGFVSIIPPNLRHADHFSQAQNQAEQKNLGIWALPEYQAHPLSKISTDHKGWRRYIGIPRTIQHKRRFTYLIFNDQVNIRIAKDHHRHFPELDTYLGKTLEVRGWTSRRNKKFSILVHHPSALILR